MIHLYSDVITTTNEAITKTDEHRETPLLRTIHIISSISHTGFGQTFFPVACNSHKLTFMFIGQLALA